MVRFFLIVFVLVLVVVSVIAYAFPSAGGRHLLFELTAIAIAFHMDRERNKGENSSGFSHCQMTDRL